MDGLVIQSVFISVNKSHLELWSFRNKIVSGKLNIPNIK